ncbi:hypothetical protein G7Y89_g4494 [Cudoniella acicularis]|uniref:NACHT domain-containing protein n=1 Tax=Cudoniella acicularis TaxID=354080 RepID=A0A8H4W7E5_9HELO|nr:hypothetical protein G7Y89_g4494 [Cudoniella acicularis]
MDPLSLTVATIAIVQTISSTYNAIRHLKGLPKAFKEVAQDLLLVKETLDLARSQLEASTLDESTQKAIEPIFKSCQEKASALSDIFQEIEKRKKQGREVKDWSTLVSFYRTLMLRMGKTHRVEALMQGMLKGLRALAVHQLFMVATKAQVEKLEKAIRKLSEIEPSLPDSEFETNSTNYTQNISEGGKGNQFNAAGGSQKNVLGHEFNATGSMNFVTNHQSISADGYSDSAIPRWLKDTSPPLPFEKKQQEIYEAASGAGEWLLDLPEFTNWRDGESRKLWCYGIRKSPSLNVPYTVELNTFIAGAGKTFLASVIINHLLRKGHSLCKNVACIYIFFDYKKHKSQNLVNLLSSLLVQLLQSRLGISAKVREVYEACEYRRIHPSIDDYVGMLKSQMENISRVYIVVDALDECLDDTKPNTLSKFLEACGKLPENAHMLFMSRPGIAFSKMIEPTCELEIVANANDMRLYLEKSINTHHRLRDMIEAELRNDNSFRDKVVNSILARSKGMQVLSQQGPKIFLTLMLRFLLAHLHLERLATHYDINRFKFELRHLSKTPDDYYQEALDRMGMQVERLRNLAINVLTWLVFAERELTISELSHAIEIYNNMAAIQTGSMALPTGSVTPSTELALTTACVGIVVVDKNSGVVRLAHNTAEEYLRNNKPAILNNAQSKIAKTCISCLMHIPLKQFSEVPPPQTELEDHYRKYPFLRYAAEHWGHHLSFRVEGVVYRLTWDFLSDRQKVNSALQAMANPLVRHETDISGLHLIAYFGLIKIVQKAVENKKRFLINERTKRGETPLHWAAIHHQGDFLKYLIEQGADLNAVEKDGKTTLHIVIYNGDEESIKVLLSSRTTIDLNIKDSQGWTPLRWAAAFGQLDVVEMLLSAGAEVDAQDKDKWTAIRWAAQRGHKEVAELLINHKASLETPNSDEWTLLRWAAKEGSEEFIQLLVEKRVDLNANDANGFTALRWAVCYGHTMVAWLLIQARADLNKPDNSGKTPLHAAAESCPTSSVSSIICLLLEKGAKVNARTKLMNLTPLHIAASRGSDSTVWLLIEKGADLFLTDVSDRTALHWAITQGHFKVAHLLAWKAKDLIHAVDNESRTALHYAASLGHIHIVDMLLDYGANIDVCDTDGKTPLYLAVSQLQEDVVACLLERGANVNVPNQKWKRRLLRLASSVGSLAINESLHQAFGEEFRVERNKSPSSEVVARKGVLGRYSAQVEDE